MITTYAYDRANRLRTATAAGGAVTTYTHDAAGHRTSVVPPGGGASYYTWDAGGRLGVAEPAAAIGPITFSYDADGRRAAKEPDGGAAVGFLYDLDRLLHETDEPLGGDVSRTYAVSATSDEFGDLISETGEMAHVYDARANTDALLDESGAADARYKYDAFGRVSAYSVEGGAWQAASAGGWPDLPPELTTHMLAGGRKQYYLDGETELFLLGAGNRDRGGRYYDAGTGRFLSEDPERDGQRESGGVGGPNLYVYAGNDPVNRLDPSGHRASDGDENEQRRAQAEQQTRPAAAGAGGMAGGRPGVSVRVHSDPAEAFDRPGEGRDGQATAPADNGRPARERVPSDGGPGDPDGKLRGAGEAGPPGSHETSYQRRMRREAAKSRAARAERLTHRKVLRAFRREMRASSRADRAQRSRDRRTLRDKTRASAATKRRRGLDGRQLRDKVRAFRRNLRQALDGERVGKRIERFFQALEGADRMASERASAASPLWSRLTVAPGALDAMFDGPRAGDMPLHGDDPRANAPANPFDLRPGLGRGPITLEDPRGPAGQGPTTLEHELGRGGPGPVNVADSGGAAAARDPLDEALDAHNIRPEEYAEELARRNAAARRLAAMTQALQDHRERLKLLTGPETQYVSPTDIDTLQTGIRNLEGQLSKAGMDPSSAVFAAQAAEAAAPAPPPAAAAPAATPAASGPRMTTIKRKLGQIRNLMESAAAAVNPLSNPVKAAGVYIAGAQVAQRAGEFAVEVVKDEFRDPVSAKMGRAVGVANGAGKMLTGIPSTAADIKEFGSRVVGEAGGAPDEQIDAQIAVDPELKALRTPDRLRERLYEGAIGKLTELGFDEQVLRRGSVVGELGFVAAGTMASMVVPGGPAVVMARLSTQFPRLAATANRIAKLVPEGPRATAAARLASVVKGVGRVREQVQKVLSRGAKVLDRGLAFAEKLVSAGGARLASVGRELAANVIARLPEGGQRLVQRAAQRMQEGMRRVRTAWDDAARGGPRKVREPDAPAAPEAPVAPATPGATAAPAGGQANAPEVNGAEAQPVPSLRAPVPRGTLTGSLKELNPAEREVVENLLGEGRNVEVVPRANDRTPDFKVDGVETELKTLSGVVKQTPDGLSAATASRIMDGRGQAGHIHVDVRGQRGMTQEIAVRGVKRAYGADNKLGGKIQSIRVVGDGFDITVPRAQ